jgi:hypothetical protein
MEFRLALARLCPYEEAKEVINVANRYFKSEERAIWVHASKLEESNGKPETCEILIGKGISKIVKKKNIFQRDEVKFLYSSGLMRLRIAKNQPVFARAERSLSQYSNWT